MAASGTFVLASHENYDKFLAAAGVPAELAAKMAAAKPTLEVQKGDTSIVIKTISGDKSWTNTITFGKDSTISLAGFEYSVNAQITEGGYKGTIKVGDKAGTAAVEKTATGYVQTMTIGGVTSTKTYTKQ